MAQKTLGWPLILTLNHAGLLGSRAYDCSGGVEERRVKTLMASIVPPMR